MGKQMSFEGMPARLMEVKIKSAKLLADADQKLKIGDSVYYLLRGEVSGVHHDRDKHDDGSLVRTHVVTVLGARRVDHEGEVADAIVNEASAFLASIDDDVESDEDEGDQ